MQYTFRNTELHFVDRKKKDFRATSCLLLFERFGQHIQPYIVNAKKIGKTSTCVFFEAKMIYTTGA